MEARALTPFPNTSRRRGFLQRHRVHTVAILCLLGCAGLLWQSSAFDSSSDGLRPRGLRNALVSAAQSSSASRRRLGSAEKLPADPAQPAALQASALDFEFEELAHIVIMSDTWVLNSDTARKLEFTPSEIKTLNKALARARRGLCEAQTRRMKISKREDGATCISIPPFDGRSPRDELDRAITTIAGAGRAPAAEKLLNCVQYRGDKDFAAFGAASLELVITNNGTVNEPLYQFKETKTSSPEDFAHPVIQTSSAVSPGGSSEGGIVFLDGLAQTGTDPQTGAPQLTSVTLLSSVRNFNSTIIPARYTHLWKSIP